MLISAFDKRSTTLSRVVGLLLVFFILYGTTVEAAHRHGQLVGSTDNQAAITTPGSSQNTLATNTGCNDCLTCQLHQHLFASLVSVGTSEAPLSPLTLSFEASVISSSSLILAPHAGRAPPQVH